MGPGTPLWHMTNRQVSADVIESFCLFILFLCCVQIVVVENAVSDVRGAFQLGVPPDNQGGAYVRREAGQVDAGLPRPCERDRVCPSNVTTILMDDLLEVVDFQHVVMKIDVEGHERRAFFHADKLFDGVNVRYIFMEWLKLRAYAACVFIIFYSQNNHRINGLIITCV